MATNRHTRDAGDTVPLLAKRGQQKGHTTVMTPAKAVRDLSFNADLLNQQDPYSRPGSRLDGNTRESPQSFISVALLSACVCNVPVSARIHTIFGLRQQECCSSEAFISREDHSAGEDFTSYARLEWSEFVGRLQVLDPSEDSLRLIVMAEVENSQVELGRCQLLLSQLPAAVPKEVTVPLLTLSTAGKWISITPFGISNQQLKSEVTLLLTAHGFGVSAPRDRPSAVKRPITPAAPPPRAAPVPPILPHVHVDRPKTNEKIKFTREAPKDNHFRDEVTAKAISRTAELEAELSAMLRPPSTPPQRNRNLDLEDELLETKRRAEAAERNVEVLKRQMRTMQAEMSSLRNQFSPAPHYTPIFEDDDVPPQTNLSDLSTPPVSRPQSRASLSARHWRKDEFEEGRRIGAPVTQRERPESANTRELVQDDSRFWREQLGFLQVAHESTLLQLQKHRKQTPPKTVPEPIPDKLVQELERKTLQLHARESTARELMEELEKRNSEVAKLQQKCSEYESSLRPPSRVMLRQGSPAPWDERSPSNSDYPLERSPSPRPEQLVKGRLSIALLLGSNLLPPALDTVSVDDELSKSYITTERHVKLRFRVGQQVRWSTARTAGALCVWNEALDDFLVSDAFREVLQIDAVVYYSQKQQGGSDASFFMPQRPMSRRLGCYQVLLRELPKDDARLVHVPLLIKGSNGNWSPPEPTCASYVWLTAVARGFGEPRQDVKQKESILWVTVVESFLPEQSVPDAVSIVSSTCVVQMGSQIESAIAPTVSSVDSTGPRTVHSKWSKPFRFVTGPSGEFDLAMSVFIRYADPSGRIVCEDVRQGRFILQKGDLAPFKVHVTKVELFSPTGGPPGAYVQLCCLAT